ncbi:phosphotransferase [uncultured Demequina sp.]|uniref:phosphotransferase n=1 Tax=uncultured Demequina sp. TaxID=693499 RepID=UPI0025EDF7EC|nr:phosphotransferase [uncultured Demequina sp.]
MELDGPLAAWLGRELGSAPREVFFEAESMSRVAGVTLADGRRVAVKIRGDHPRLAAAAAAQRAAGSAGIDVPALLAGPAPAPGDAALAVTVEDWREEGALMPSADAPVAFARLLAALVEALEGVPTAGLSPPPWLDYAHTDAARVWPPPASARWDPHRIEADLPAELPSLAARARARLAATTLPPVLGHADLNGLNVRWNGDRPLVHDWDSIAALPEAVLAGTLALDHVAMPDAGAAADVDTGARVLAEYEAARGRMFTPEEREIAWATTVWLACYNAAFEHLHGAAGAVTARILADGEARLALAGA